MNRAVMVNRKWVFTFQEGHAKMVDLLGGKGANLAEMTRAGLAVPPGFTVTTEACLTYFKDGNRLNDVMLHQILMGLAQLEREKGQVFGERDKPLLVSVRSGSVTSMPGMMDTILNVGLNDETVVGISELTGNPRFAFDCYRRLIQMFGHVVMGVESHLFEQQLDRMKTREGVLRDEEISAAGLQQLVQEYKLLVLLKTGKGFPQNVVDQLRLAIEAVFSSWNNARAQVYRRMHRIPDDQGTAVNIQSMVFGNMGETCGTGVVFTRNPSTGENILFGEFLLNAQGEDVVAGIRTPMPIAMLEQVMPDAYDELQRTVKQLEFHYQDIQDIEFTIEHHKLYLLQTRSGKRNAQAALKIAVDLVHEGIITKRQAIERIDPMHLEQLLHRAIREDAQQAVAKGLPASPGAAVGQVALDAETAALWGKEGKRVILVRPETTPEDIEGVLASEGVATLRGGMTSHAAVVARGMGKPCVCGCETIEFLASERGIRIGSQTIHEGDWMTIDGHRGLICLGELELKEPEMTEALMELLAWADEVRTLRILANADHPYDAQVARQYGAEGIGLCRTEHMFFDKERLPIVQRMILAEHTDARRDALAQLLPMQQSDFEGMLEAMNGLPVTIRLLDPPLHEFLPKRKELQERLQHLRGLHGTDQEIAGIEATMKKVEALEEINPMLGQRGCRLGIVYPEVYDMQIEAIFKAAASCLKRGIAVLPEIMIPLVGHVTELKFFRERIEQIASEMLSKKQLQQCAYRVGTMIEVPRAALTAHQIAVHADFFSFGTNDLTQMTLGYSRDDAEGKFMSQYLDRRILAHNPFQVLDEEGVGQLIQIANTTGKSVKPELKAGVCGEHGGDPQSIRFCHAIGLEYVSCSPYRIPLARIAAAQAVIAEERQGVEEAMAESLLAERMHA
ncbi:pyruvate, phosphate dikinase [Paenibacillus guangzhouensis]|uniref:pyruvate, phosphate dikinase n=1 Tax=Paenibacillus guangzhouensis TaxID=1473112 RepID=UPI001D125E49|nr:pyruvate, phosphate dikinase [Paenibacillus guangzhouensis]